MARVCKITGKRPLVGNNVSKSNRKTKEDRFLIFNQKEFMFQN